MLYVLVYTQKIYNLLGNWHVAHAKSSYLIYPDIPGLVT